MIDEILELGFDTMELSYGMTISKFPGIQKAYLAGKFRCLALLKLSGLSCLLIVNKIIIVNENL